MAESKRHAEIEAALATLQQVRDDMEAAVDQLEECDLLRDHDRIKAIRLGLAMREDNWRLGARLFYAAFDVLRSAAERGTGPDEAALWSHLKKRATEEELRGFEEAD